MGVEQGTNILISCQRQQREGNVGNVDDREVWDQSSGELTVLRREQEKKVDTFLLGVNDNSVEEGLAMSTTERRASKVQGS
jgi:hypothetical protein